MQMQNIRASLQQRWQRSPFIFKSVFAMNIVVRKRRRVLTGILIPLRLNHQVEKKAGVLTGILTPLRLSHQVEKKAGGVNWHFHSPFTFSTNRLFLLL